MEINIIIGGQAGQGTQKASEILSKAFVRAGYYAFDYRDYQSLIRGGHNYNGVKISDEPIYSHEEEEIDFLLALDQNTISKHFSKLKENGKVIADRRINSDRKIEVNVNEILKEVGLTRISENIVLISVLWKILGLPPEILRETVLEELDEKNAKIVDAVFSREFSEVMKVEVRERKKKYFLTGSHGVALGAIAAGLDLYIAYPMTPASPVLHILASLQDKYNFRVFHPENEIAVANMALGASYAGAKVMVGTSGGGFALMNEALSLQGMSEVPLVVYLAQRYAPATGIPTYTSQGDLKFALNAGHGEFPRVVVAPGDPAEAFRRTVEAFYLAYKYRVLSIILSDTYLAEAHATFDELPRVNLPTDRFIELNPSEGYKYYKITDNGISPRTIPGLKDEVLVKANSYEHDELGITTEEGEWAIKMSNKRWKKFEELKKEVENFEPFKIYGEGNKLIVCWGSTKGPALDAIKKLSGWKVLHVSYISPLSPRIREVIESADKVVLVENNVTGLFGQVLKEQLGIEIEHKILKYDARPFTAKYLIKRLSSF